MTTPATDLSLVSGDHGVSFWIHVTPRARRDAVGGVRGDALRVAVNAPPSDGAANLACVALLAKILGATQRSIDLPLSSKNRRKRVRISGDPNALKMRLMELAVENGT